jgi:hypothetical protein
MQDPSVSELHRRFIFAPGVQHEEALEKLSHPVVFSASGIGGMSEKVNRAAESGQSREFHLNGISLCHRRLGMCRPRRTEQDHGATITHRMPTIEGSAWTSVQGMAQQDSSSNGGDGAPYGTAKQHCDREERHINLESSARMGDAWPCGARAATHRKR